MATLCNYTQTEAKNLTVVRMKDQLLIRVIIGEETHHFICTEPDAAAKSPVLDAKQVMVRLSGTVEELFQNIDKQG
jgi:hypothetical protein